LVETRARALSEPPNYLSDLVTKEVEVRYFSHDDPQVHDIDIHEAVESPGEIRSEEEIDVEYVWKQNQLVPNKKRKKSTEITQQRTSGTNKKENKHNTKL